MGCKLGLNNEPDYRGGGYSGKGVAEVLGKIFSERSRRAYFAPKMYFKYKNNSGFTADSEIGIDEFFSGDGPIKEIICKGHRPHHLNGKFISECEGCSYKE